MPRSRMIQLKYIRSLVEVPTEDKYRVIIAIADLCTL